ncbi:MAG TPA: phosphoenolpyruvate--protein phosphotransferase [Paenibacillaceae bacterium]
MIQGRGASGGIAIGKAFVLPDWEWELPEHRVRVEDLAREFERLSEGIRRSKHEITQLKNELDEVVGRQEASIFDAHLAILDDPVFMSEIQGIIRRQYKAAEVAVKEAIDHFVAMFDLLDDEYMKERAADIKDVGNRLLKHLLGVPEIDLPSDSRPFILVVRELSPSQLVHLKPDLVLGIATMAGSPTSHAAIMAKAFGIPLVTGLEGKFPRPIMTGELLILDGDTGIVHVNPDEATIAEYTERQKRQQAHRRQLRRLADVPAITPDGVKIHLASNISSIPELEAALQNGAESVGLFRTEFLYMNSPRFPTEEEQYRVYRRAAEMLKGQPLVIRTLDIGGDKYLDYYELPEEENPSLGYRAIRFSLDRKDLFKVQLRAVLRAAAYGNVQLMYPLIASVEEVRAANEVLREAARELAMEGVPHRADIPVGIMIEVPAAVAIADLLAEEVAFFSIGTNDLIQFALAVDRMNERVGWMCDPYQPSVLRMLKAVVDAAERRRVPVTVCGELAGDVKALPMLLGLGIRGLSMAGQSILPVKEYLLRTPVEACRALVGELLGLRTAEEIRARLERFYQETKLTAGHSL